MKKVLAPVITILTLFSISQTTFAQSCTPSDGRLFETTLNAAEKDLTNEIMTKFRVPGIIEGRCDVAKILVSYDHNINIWSVEVPSLDIIEPLEERYTDILDLLVCRMGQRFENDPTLELTSSQGGLSFILKWEASLSFD